VTLKNAVFWDVTWRASRKNRRFGGRIASIVKETRIGELGTTLSVTSNRNTTILFTLMMAAIRSSEVSVLTRATRNNIPEDGILDFVWFVP
jgi:hypothetical protein